MDLHEDRPRLIEHAFPLKQASIDSVHEKNVRHGHISTLHIWPARRPLAACRAALIATLLPDPGTPQERRRLLEKIGGTVVKNIQKKKLHGKVVEVEKEETLGGVLHWGNENNPDMEWFRQEIRKAYGGRAPRVLDPFAGGGAIPLEAMRLGCEATAIDINPVAWFILKCTLEYPQKLAGQKRRLPDFILKDRDFMEEFFKSQGLKGASLRTMLQKLGLEGGSPLALLKGFEIPDAVLEADLAWHVRAWGRWVLERARTDLDKYYPTIDGKPTVAYLWARTVKCKNCSATIPLLKTRWLCRRDQKRVVLTMAAKKDKTGVEFGIDKDLPVKGKNAAERREHDKKLGQGTMSRNGAWCPCCGKPGTVAMNLDDIREQGLSGRIGTHMTAVILETRDGKDYRPPVTRDLQAANLAIEGVPDVFKRVPFGIPHESINTGSVRKGGVSVTRWGYATWEQLFSHRQLLALGTFVANTRDVSQAMSVLQYPVPFQDAVRAYLGMAIDKLVDYCATLCTWHITGEKMSHVFVRYALPITWDFAELNPLSSSSGNYSACLDWVARVAHHCTQSALTAPRQDVTLASAMKVDRITKGVDAIITDPPYYDAIPYADLTDIFYVWLRRVLSGLSPEADEGLATAVIPKWDHTASDGELVDDESRFGGDSTKSKEAYENGMFRVFEACHGALASKGRLVIVFANKQPDAWEALVSAIMRAGFVVDASWPIQTEMGNRTRALSAAALSSSVWLVCKRRIESTPPGWDNRVLDEMRHNIHKRLREYWDAGIRGPDFVWAATGPALEAYSKHPVVKKANEPGEVLTVPEFLRAVRRIVVDFVVGRVLSRDGADTDVSGLDDVTTYYLLHRNDFAFDDAPAGACILYAVSCGLSDSALCDSWDVLLRSGGSEPDDEAEPETENGDEPEEGSGATLRLRPWHQRKRKSMGYDEGRPAPLIDQVHRLMHLWKAGEVVKVDEYVEERGLRRHELFKRVLQALIELAPPASEERSILESLSNHLAARGATRARERDLPGIEA